MDTTKLQAGQALDSLVAEKVMGWDIHFRDPGLRNGIEHWRDPEHSTIYLPNQWCPSSDIAAAWEVVDRIHDLQPRFILEAQPFVRPRVWWCSVYGHDRIEAPTAPLAICLAALKCVDA